MKCETNYSEIIALKLRELGDTFDNQESFQNKKKNILKRKNDDLNKKLCKKEKMIENQRSAIILLGNQDQELFKNRNEDIKQDIDELKKQLCEKEKIILDRNLEITFLKEKYKELLLNNQEDILQDQINDLKWQMRDINKVIKDQHYEINVLKDKNQKLLTNGKKDILQNKTNDLKKQLNESNTIIETENLKLNILNDQIQKLTNENQEYVKQIECLKLDLEVNNNCLKGAESQCRIMKTINQKISNYLNTNSKTWLMKEKSYKKKIADMNEYIKRLRAEFEEQILGIKPEELTENSRVLSVILEEDECNEKTGSNSQFQGIEEFNANNQSISSADASIENESELFTSSLEVLKQENAVFMKQLAVNNTIIGDQISRINLLNEKIKELFDQNEAKNKMNQKMNNMMKINSNKWFKKEEDYKKKIADMNDHITRLRSVIEERILEIEPEETISNSRPLSPVIEEDSDAESDIPEKAMFYSQPKMYQDITPNDQAIGLSLEVLNNNNMEQSIVEGVEIIELEPKKATRLYSILYLFNCCKTKKFKK